MPLGLALRLGEYLPEGTQRWKGWKGKTEHDMLTDDLRTWPVNEQVVDLLHKFVFAFVTGYAADRLIQ